MRAIPNAQMGRLSAFFKTGEWGQTTTVSAGMKRALTAREEGQIVLRASVAAPCDSPGNSAPCERMAAINSAGVIS